MRTAIIRWTIYLIALLIAGPAAGMLVGLVHSADGRPGSPLVSTTPILGLFAVGGALAIAFVIGLIAARLLGLAPAMTASGLVVAWAAWKTADVDQLIRTAGSGSPLVRLAVEGAIIGMIGLAIALACWIVSRPVEDSGGTLNRRAWRWENVDTAAERHATAQTLRGALLPGKTALVGIGAGLLAGGVAAWLVGATPLKGQAVFAAIAAGTFAAAAARLVDYEAQIPAMFLPVLFLAVLGPLLGLVLAGSNVVASSYKGALFPLANISPLAWIAGGLLGIPIGVSWAGSMIEKRLQEA